MTSPLDAAPCLGCQQLALAIDAGAALARRLTAAQASLREQSVTRARGRAALLLLVVSQVLTVWGALWLVRGLLGRSP